MRACALEILYLYALQNRRRGESVWDDDEAKTIHSCFAQRYQCEVARRPWLQLKVQPCAAVALSQPKYGHGRSLPRIYSGTRIARTLKRKSESGVGCSKLIREKSQAPHDAFNEVPKKNPCLILMSEIDLSGPPRFLLR